MIIVAQIAIRHMIFIIRDLKLFKMLYVRHAVLLTTRSLCLFRLYRWGIHPQALITPLALPVNLVDVAAAHVD